MPTPAPTPAAHGMGPNPAASAATTGDTKGVRFGGLGAGIGGMGPTPAPSPAVSGVTTGDAEGVRCEVSGAGVRDVAKKLLKLSGGACRLVSLKARPLPS